MTVMNGLPRLQQDADISAAEIEALPMPELMQLINTKERDIGE